MVISCVAFGCRNRQHIKIKRDEVCDNQVAEEENDILVETDYETGQCYGADRPRPISFHRFPANEEKRNLWITAVGRWKWHPTKFSHICSDHFHFTDYKVPPGHPRPRLTPSAVPSVFQNSPNHLRKESLKKRGQLAGEQQHLNIMEKEKERSEPALNSPEHLVTEPSEKRGNLTADQLNLKSRKEETEESDPVPGSPKQLMTEPSKKRRQLITEQPNIKIRKEEKQNSESVPRPDQSLLLIKKLRKKIKVLQQKLRRRDKRLKALREYVNEVKQKTVISQSSTHLKDNFSISFVELFINEVKNGLERLLDSGTK